MAAGCRVHDIGLALSPMAYFAQFALDVPAVAMVTASHNENGWTGVKMGADRPVTFGPEEMGRLKEIVLAGAIRRCRAAAPTASSTTFRDRYIADLTNAAEDSGASSRWSPPAATAPPAPSRRRCSRRSAARSSRSTAELDYTFPRYNPNPEDMAMLHAMAEAVRESGADVGLGFDGDGDRCGVVDNEGKEIFADKIGVMLARDLSALHPGAQLRRRREVDRPVRDRSRCCRRNGVETDYWKTGHSYIKRRVRRARTRSPASRSRGISSSTRRSAAAMTTASSPRSPSSTCSTATPASRWPTSTRALPKTWGSPTMSPHCADEVKYGVVERVVTRFEACTRRRGEAIAGAPIARPRDGQRRPRRHRGRHMGAGARLLEQAGTGGGGREPGFGGADARDVQGRRRASCARIREVGAYNQTI